jgi:hypothetical protein
MEYGVYGVSNSELPRCWLDPRYMVNACYFAGSGFPG